MKYLLFIAASICLYSCASKEPQYIELRVYHHSDSTQESVLDAYLKESLIPGLHRLGISSVGVFRPIPEDTVNGGKTYVLFGVDALEKLSTTSDQLEKDTQYMRDAQAYLQTPHDRPPFRRIETIWMKSFSGMPEMKTPALKGERSSRIYELRSYEGPTEQLYKEKVHMFNVGDEISLFDSLGFNAVFYGEVLSGSHMPNLMYMTTFDNMSSRTKKWELFMTSPKWKDLSSMDRYQHTVSRADIFLLRPTEYSDY